MKEYPLVSVIIPVYNAEAFLAEAIESAFAQTWRPLEVVVVDDGSTDGSLEVSRRYEDRVKIFSQPNAGISAARNRGLETASGNFFAFLDADDLWPESKLEKQMAALAADATLDMVFGLMIEFISPAEGRQEEARRTARTVVPQPSRLPGAMLIRKEAFDRVGPFDEKIKLGEFVDWYARAREAGLNDAVLPDLVLERRIHGGNIGIRKSRDLSTYARILKASIDRRREAGKDRKDP